MIHLRFLPLLLVFAVVASAQTEALRPIESFPLDNSLPVLHQKVAAGEPFTVAGPHGVIVGQQEGEFESWILPVKLLSHWTIEANVEGYPVPIQMNQMARELEVRSDRTTITFSHIALSIRQTMFAADGMKPGTGTVVMYQIDSLKPVDLVFRFNGEMRKMWPQLSSGPPSPEWVKTGDSGYYVLHTDFPDFAGAVALPTAKVGVLAPYQERPQTHPLEFRLHVDPTRDRGKVFPLLMAVGMTPETATNAALFASLSSINSTIPSLYAQHAELWHKRAATQTTVDTPDESVNTAFQWAATSIEQLRATTLKGEQALVAGYYSSGDSARPGFGWFFGRDALYSLYAVHGFGDFALAKQELEFLLKRQRSDGKIMHEYSQTADYVDWALLPYEYAAADATPLFLTTILDYVQHSGDVEFLKNHQEGLRKAWQFEISHDADHDGIYDNAQGTGWVESWPPGMPKQEIYLALLDEQASTAMSQLATMTGDSQLTESAKARAARIHQTIETEYFDPAKNEYAFSWNAGTKDQTATSFPSIAWWNGGAGLQHAGKSLEHWASHDFETDWGTRDVAESDSLFNGMSYHQGSVWPLFTGWAALAQYRAGNPLAGYQATMQNVGLTTVQDLGAVTELLSGDFFEPFGRSTSHQLWSSAMVTTPILRGVFGITVNAIDHNIEVTPRLPAQWQKSEVNNVHVGDSVVDLAYERSKDHMLVKLNNKSGPKVQLKGADARGVLRVPLPKVEVGIDHALPERGSRTTQTKVLSTRYEGQTLHLELEGMANTQQLMYLRLNGIKSAHAEGAVIAGDHLRIDFGSGSGYVRKSIHLTW